MEGFNNIKSLMRSKYPEIDTLMKIVNLMVRKYHEECISSGIAIDLDGDGYMDENEEDERWAWYNHENSFLQNDELQGEWCKGVKSYLLTYFVYLLLFIEKFLHTFGYFWHLLVEISKCIRTQGSDDVLENLKSTNGLVPPEDVLYAHSTDKGNLGEHCPDFALTLERGPKLIVLTICGTRMIPAPEMQDVFMDLYADSEPFLHGHAHRGMAIGCRNILERILPHIVSTLEENPDYEIMVTGYSLGAGISQLVTMELLEGQSRERLPSNVVIRCFNYGTPPVFCSDKYDEYKCPNVYSITFNNDGLISASSCRSKPWKHAHEAKGHSDVNAISPSDDTEDLATVLEEDEDEMGDTGMSSSRSSGARFHAVDLVHLEHPSKLFIFSGRMMLSQGSFIIQTLSRAVFDSGPLCLMTTCLGDIILSSKAMDDVRMIYI
ncbi:Uncharacterized protein FKW44_000747 [Caligus rogercresseyi]|uniref:Fungal lipase-type domain-containing protein n=1 Tax=Caligus rogercresseyi TaxID=217165 RepID=A0A7T8QV37_CALRO|nr:Uncharacterized protein FKW44_000747 [Caligus rogercresseyi]